MTSISKEVREMYDSKIVDYFNHLGKSQPEMRVENLANSYPLAYYLQAVEACRHEIVQYGIAGATPDCLEMLVKQRNLAEDMAARISHSQKTKKN